MATRNLAGKLCTPASLALLFLPCCANVELCWRCDQLLGPAQECTGMLLVRVGAKRGACGWDSGAEGP